MSVKSAIQSIGQHANMMPRQSGVTLPMIRMEPGKLVLYRVFYLKHPRPGKPTTISYPTYIASFDLAADRFMALKKFERKIEISGEEPWPVEFYKFEKPADIIDEYNAIWACYDVLIALFLKPDKSAPTHVEKDKAREYIHYYGRHAEKPLRPVYDVYGGVFHSFIEKIA